jgi:hypothetical protein
MKPENFNMGQLVPSLRWRLIGSRYISAGAISPFVAFYTPLLKTDLARENFGWQT